MRENGTNLRNHIEKHEKRTFFCYSIQTPFNLEFRLRKFDYSTF